MTISNQQPRGVGVLRIAIAQAIARGDSMGAAAYAEAKWGAFSMPARCLTAESAGQSLFKAAVDPGSAQTGDDATWGDALADYRKEARQLIAAVNEVSVVGSMLQGFRRAPLRSRHTAQTARVAAGWTGETRPRRVSQMALEAIVMQPFDLSGMLIASSELMRHADPIAEFALRRDLIEVIAEMTDEAFLNPAQNAIPNVCPAAITNGVTPSASTGDPGGDVATLVRDFPGDLNAAYFVLHSDLAAEMAMHRDGTGGPLFPALGVRGGEILGVPAIVSRNVPSESGGSMIALIDPSAILFGDDGAMVTASEQASVQLDDDPDDPSSASTVMVNLWQRNLVGIRCIRPISWVVGRPCVAYMTGVSYGVAS